MKAWVWWVVVGSVVLTGCSTSSSPDDEPSPAVQSSNLEQGPVGLRETCPEIEVALPADPSVTVDQLQRFGDRLVELHEQGDTETQNALNLIGRATLDLREALEQDARGADLLEARDGFRRALTAVADRCAVAGSSALR